MYAYGFLEITGVTAAMTSMDIMGKTSAVELVSWERKWGGMLVTIIIKGDIAAVNEAIEAAKANGIKEVKVSGVLANPHPEVVRMVNLSAQRLRRL